MLKECIARAGSIEGGLRYYVGAANLPSDGGYAAKVLAEHQRLRQGAGLRANPVVTTNTVTADSKSAISTESTKVSHADQVAVADSRL